MKLNELTPEDFVLRPPPQMLWVKRHYCPLVEESIRLMERQRVALEVFNKRKRSNLNYLRIGPSQRRAVQKAWEPWPSLLGGNLTVDGAFVNIIANIEGTDKVYRAYCAIDDALYLLPYLFRTVPCHHYVNGKFIAKGWVDQLIPERWDKLKKMNIIGKLDEVIEPMSNRSYSGGRLDVRIGS